MGNELEPYFSWFLGSLTLLFILTYIFAGMASSRKPRLSNWPTYRYFLWTLGMICVSLSMVGPLANRSHMDFTWHMTSHLLLGMLGPLLLTLAAPMKLLLRSINVRIARKIVVLLKSKYICFISHPVTASILNIGGLWILYTTDLFVIMHDHFLVYVLVHFHVFMAGYVFTISMIYIDPVSHRKSFLYRTVVFIFALAGHGILSKYLYAYPPQGVSKGEGESGAMLMYYGGDLIDMMLIMVLFYQWYRSAKPRDVLAQEQA